MTSETAFMVAETCVAEPSYKRGAYSVEHHMICEGLPPEEAAETGCVRELMAQVSSEYSSVRPIQGG